MDNFDDIFSAISSNVKTKEEKDSVLNLLNDVIEQTYRAEKEFNDLKDVFSLVLESLPHPIWVINEDGDYFYYNSYANKLNEMLSHCPYEFNTKSIFECEVLFKNEWFLIKKNTKNNKTIITATNITNEKQKQRLASMGQISAHLAHEIRNPIGAIALITSSLLKRANPKDKIYLLSIKKALWRVEKLINATLLFSKGIKSISKQNYNSELIKNSILDFIEYIEYSKEINFIYEIKEPFICCDRELIYIVLQNIIVNAIECIEDSECINEGVIKVEFFCDEKYQILNIYDNGNLDIDIDNLFEAFKTTKVKGTGLGLALCKQIINAHNGSIIYNPSPKHFSIRIEK